MQHYFPCRATVWSLFLVIALVGGRDLGATAQAPAVVSDAPPAMAPNLSVALAAARPPTNGLALTVGADTVSRLPEAVLPGVQPSVAEVADEYGRITQRFGAVTAVAPSSMTVLHTENVTPPDPFDGVPPNEALKLLFGGLDDRQWALLTGDTGLGFADLSDDQRSLFQSLFPDGTLQVDTSRGASGRITLKADDLQQVRLRLGQRTQISLPLAGQAHSFIGIGLASDGVQYQASIGMTAGGRGTLFGLHVRDTVPNAPKPSDLDFRAELWQTRIDPRGAKTVGELIARIGSSTRAELDADRHYENRSVVVLGSGTVAAGDLLRALAFCVCGAYRQVGPAFVLSSDRIGLAVQRALLARVPQEAALLRAGAVEDAGEKLFAVRGGSADLPPCDAAGVTDAQKAQAAPFDRIWWPSNGVSLLIPWAQLTPPQQDLARREADQYRHLQGIGGMPNSPVTLEGTFQLSAQPVLELLSPAVPTPVQVGGNWQYRLFEPSYAFQEAYRKRMQVTLPRSNDTTPRETAPPLSHLMARFRRRAVLARPQSAADVRALVADMKRLGLNQLWLDVFSGGEDHLEKSGDVLAAAVAQTKGTGILVVPTLSLLAWGLNVPAEAADQTLLGENSAQEQMRQRREGSILIGTTPPDADKLPPVTTVSVSPAEPSVQETLLALVRRLVATPGVAALAVRDTVTNGYENDQSTLGADELGYTVPLRLAFLRRWHVDPTDPLSTGKEISGPDQPDTSVPEFEDSAPVGADLTGAWNEARRAADLDLMRCLLAAAQTKSGRQIPLLVGERGMHWTQDWYGLWTDPRAPLPVMTQAAIFHPPGNDNFAPLAHAQCRVALFAFPTWFNLSRESLTYTLQRLKPGWDGIVLNVSDHPGGDALRNLLELAQTKADSAPGAKPPPAAVR